MTLFKILCFILLSCLSSQAENTSFMLTDAEQQSLNQTEGKVEEKTTPLPQSIIFLSAILYFNPDKWTLWLNNQVIHQQGEFQGASLKSVSPDHVVFGLEGEEFLLKPNQSFLVNARKVVEGDKRSIENRPLEGPAPAAKH